MIKLKQILLKENDFLEDGELERGEKIYNGLIARGFDKHGAICLIGNIAHESACDPKRKQDGGPGYGLCQWDPGRDNKGRKQALQAFAAHTKRPISDLTTQLDFIKFELLNGYTWNRKYVPGIKDKQLYLYKQQDGSYKGQSNFLVKQYKNSLTGNIRETTKKLMINVFRPKSNSSLKKRINNSLKFKKYLDGDIDTPEKKSTTDSNIYTVKDGDTLSSIAAKQPVGITIKTIAKANKISQDSILRPGQKLIIPKPKKPK
jgi:hypothetical protein